MKKLIKPASLVFYLLIVLVFFFVGMYVAKLVGAGKNQMLAGGAIVLFYGIASAGIAFILAIPLVYRVEHTTIVRINKILGILFFLLIFYTTYKLVTRTKEEAPVEEHSKKTTATVQNKISW